MGGRIGTKLAAGIAALGLLLGGAGVAAWASSEIAPGSAASANLASAARRGSAASTVSRFVAGADHGSFVRKVSGKWVTMAVDRGKVASVAVDHLTLTRPDGQSVTLTLTPTTRYTGATSANGLATNRATTIVSNVDGTVRKVAQRV